MLADKITDVLCFSETWIKPDCNVGELKIPGYERHLNSIGLGELLPFSKVKRLILKTILQR